MYQGLKTRRACRTDLPQAFGKLILYPIYTSGKDNDYFYRIVGMTLLDHRKKLMRISWTERKTKEDGLQLSRV